MGIFFHNEYLEVRTLANIIFRIVMVSIQVTSTEKKGEGVGIFGRCDYSSRRNDIAMPEEGNRVVVAQRVPSLPYLL